uniref:Flagellar and Swarming motility protein n=1 Tax=Siphoviridae sp. ctmHK36 TaxID=2827931 RepID=A0A8S5TBQ0_9CAUD|nr:MAG TPA: Flagellar and Swarming motility protein [Siphoviridae sp. ctmHK36]
MARFMEFHATFSGSPVEINVEVIKSFFPSKLRDIDIRKITYTNGTSIDVKENYEEVKRLLTN